jgi:hypothetical protein
MMDVLSWQPVMSEREIEVALFTRGSQQTSSQKQQKCLGSEGQVVTTDSRR